MVAGGRGWQGASWIGRPVGHGCGGEVVLDPLHAALESKVDDGAINCALRHVSNPSDHRRGAAGILGDLIDESI